MAQCYQCTDEATTTTLIVGFENGQAKTRIISNRCWGCTNKINNFMKRDYNERMQEVREEREERERKQEEKKEAERKRKEREKNKSCCRVCGNSSWFNHLVIDTKNEKVENKSTSYIVNPDYEIIVCNQDCLKKWYNKTFSFTCPQCSKSGTDSIVKNKKRFCSSKCGNDYFAKYTFTCAECQLNQEHEEIWSLSGFENQGKQFCSKYCCNQHQLLKCDDCGEKIFTASYWKDIDNKSGNLCVNCYIKQRNNNPSEPTIPKSEPKKPTSPPQQTPTVNDEDSSNGNTRDSSSSDENEKTCAKCGQKGTKYNIPSKNDDKEFCSKTCGADYYYYKEKNNNSSVDTKKINKCDKCSKEISKSEKRYYADAKNKTGTLCSNCLDKELEEETKDNNSQKGNSNSPREKLKPIADTLKTGKDLVRQGYKPHEINTGQLSISQQRELENYYNNLNKTEEKHFLDTRLGLAVCIAGWILVPTGIISLIVWVVRRRKKKLKK